MPELPEVETVTRALRPHLIDRQIVKTVTRIERLRNVLDIHQREDILWQRIISVNRRAKYIVIEMENLRVIILHLGMSGSCRIEKSLSTIRSHDHISWYLDNEMIWRFNDPRKFGMAKVDCIEKPGTFPRSLQQLPPEPLSENFSSTYLYQAIEGRTKAIKSILMDTNLVAGLGNIYASESLFLAGVNPQTPGGKLSAKPIEELVKSIRKVLREAIHAGGTTIANFKSVDGNEGKFSLQLHVYGKENKRCPRCRNGKIKRIAISGRSTFYCPHCQK